MVQLLKQKSKLVLQQKPRKKYEVKSIFKRPKTDAIMASIQTSQVNQIFGKTETKDGKKKIIPDVIETPGNPQSQIDTGS